MPNQTDTAWNILIGNLARTASRRDVLSELTLGLAETLRDLGAPAPNRLNCAIPGASHFEWVSNRATMVIILQADGKGEVVTCSNQGEYVSEAFRWECRPISELLGLPHSKEVAPPLGKRELFHA